MTRLRLLVMMLLALGMIGGASVRTTYAASTDHVTTCAASGTGSLPSVVSASGTGDTVVFDQDCSGGNVILLGSPITIAHTLIIDGSGHSVVIDGGSTTGNGLSFTKLFQISAPATFNQLTLQNAGGAPDGGAIAISHGAVTVTSCTFSNDAAGSGGAIYDQGGSLSVSNSTFSGNSAVYGGAIYNDSPTLTVSGSTFSNNSAVVEAFDFGLVGGNGGAIANEAVQYAATATISASTFSGNTAAKSAGAIDNHGTVTVSGSTFSSNYAADPTDNAETSGGAIGTSGTATITTSTFTSNHATQGGGAIANTGTLSVSATTLSGNFTTPDTTAESPNSFGGGILNSEGSLAVLGSTFTGNNVTADGGAIENFAGFGLISNSTFVSNSAIEGGGIDNEINPNPDGNYPYVKLFTSTFSNDSATSGGAVFNHGGTLAIHGTILANSPDGYNCLNRNSGTVTDEGYNLSYNAYDPTHDGLDVCGTSSIGDLLNTDPQLGALASNGGPTQTMALQAGSMAIDHTPVSTAICPAADQRGYVRADDSETSCDVGAYESGAAPPVITVTSSANPSPAGQQVTYTASVNPSTATGTVAFQDGGSTISSCASQTMSSGHATCAVTYANTGSHTITASYSGDDTYAGNTSSALTQTVDTSLSGFPTLPGGAYNLRNASLSGAFLVNANLAGANVTNATLTGANLSRANLTGANLTGANLSGAKLAGAILTNANLTQTNLRNALGLASATITGITWKQTTCPDGTTSNQDGGTCQGH